MASRKDVDIRISATDATASGFSKTRQGLDSISVQLNKFRNEVRITAGAFVAFQAAIVPVFGALRSQITGLVQSGREFETLRAQFSGLLGSIEAGDEAIAWVDRFAEGVPFQTSQVAEAFVKLKAFGLDPTNGSLRALTNQASLLGGSQETLEGIILAVGQAWAKQKLQGEEALQLLERGVPVWDLLSEATGKSAVELQELSKKGDLGRESIALLLREIDKFAAGASEKQLGTLGGQLDLITDNWGRFQKQVGDSGLNDFIRDTAAEVNKLFAELRDSGQLDQIARAISDTIVGIGAEVNKLFAELRDSGQLDQIARAISDTIVGIGTAIRYSVQFIIDFRDEIALAVKVAAGLSLVALRGQIIALGGVLAAAAKRMYAFATATLRARSALLSLQAALPVVGAAIAGWEIGSYLREEFEEVEKFGIALASGLTVAFERVKQALENIPDFVRVAFVELFDFLKRRVSSFIDSIAGLYDYIPGIGKQIGDGYRQVSKSIAEGVGESADAIYARIAERNAKFEGDIQRIKDEYADLFSLVGKHDAQQSNPAPSPQPDPEFTFGAGQGGAGAAEGDSAAAEAAKRERERLDTELQAVRDKIAQSEADTLEERLALIRQEYAKLITDLKAIGNTAGAGDVERLVEIEQQAERLKFATEQQAAAEQRLNELISTRQSLLSVVETDLASGLETQAGAQQRIKDINAEYLPLITKAADEARRLADNLGDSAAVAKIDAMKSSVTAVRREVVVTGEQINDSLAGGLSNALMDVARGTQTAKDAFRSFAADFLRQIAQMILQAAILKSLQSAFGGGIGEGIAGGINGLVAHDGALVGIRGGTRRRVPAMAFAGAPRYHSGGIAGLKPGEVPAILERGEQVIPRDQVGQGGQMPNIKIVNSFDSSSVVSEGLSSAAGEQAFINLVRRNKSAVKSILGG